MALLGKEKDILNSIVVRSENDPTRPEFPPEAPRFPATETRQIEVPGFSNVWLKDESTNLTGTHKDRLAWEVIVTYRDILRAIEKDENTRKPPQMSLISSGAAAAAVQTKLKKYDLPNLKVLVDNNIAQDIYDNLERMGCELYKIDLSTKPFRWDEVLTLTENPNGFDISSSSAIDPTTRFYDWMSYEILNQSSDFIFVPFGSGNLYENILNMSKREFISEKPDPRFTGTHKMLTNCNILGATTDNPNSIADKLYSHHLPNANYSDQWIRFFRDSGYCGQQSMVHVVEENFLEQAVELAEKLEITAEPSGIAGLGLMLQMADSIPKDAKVLIVNTGKTCYLIPDN